MNELLNANPVVARYSERGFEVTIRCTTANSLYTWSVVDPEEIDETITYTPQGKIYGKSPHIVDCSLNYFTKSPSLCTDRDLESARAKASACIDSCIPE